MHAHMRADPHDHTLCMPPMLAHARAHSHSPRVCSPVGAPPHAATHLPVGSGGGGRRVSPLRGQVTLPWQPGGRAASRGNGFKGAAQHPTSPSPRRSPSRGCDNLSLHTSSPLGQGRAHLHLMHIRIHMLGNASPTRAHTREPPPPPTVASPKAKRCVNPHDIPALLSPARFSSCHLLNKMCCRLCSMRALSCRGSYAVQLRTTGTGQWCDRLYRATQEHWEPRREERKRAGKGISCHCHGGRNIASSHAST